MRKIAFILLGILVLSCNKKQEIKAGNLPFFHFDKIDYYKTSITEDSLQAIAMNQDKSRQEQALLQIVRGNVPVSTMDTLFIKNMDVLSFRKSEIDSSQFKKITDIFSVKDLPLTKTTACIPVYRDILIFREKGKVIGMVKICFDCEKNQIIGSRYNTANFGSSNEYTELGVILQESGK